MVAESTEMEVLSAAAVVWMCPECGHGSSEIRDERAHLDAHRQLQAFLQEWDAGTESGQGRRRRSQRRLVLLYTAVALLVLLASVGLFARVNSEPGDRRSTVPTIVVPDATVVPPTTPTTAVPTRKTAPVARDATPTVRSTPASPAATAAQAVTAADSIVAPRASAPAQPTAAPVAVPPPTAVGPTPPPHLLQLCLLGLCLTVP